MSDPRTPQEVARAAIANADKQAPERRYSTGTLPRFSDDSDWRHNGDFLECRECHHEVGSGHEPDCSIGAKIQRRVDADEQRCPECYADGDRVLRGYVKNPANPKQTIRCPNPFHSEPAPVSKKRCPTCGGNPRVPNLVAANAYCPDPFHSEPAPAKHQTENDRMYDGYTGERHPPEPAPDPSSYLTGPQRKARRQRERRNSEPAPVSEKRWTIWRTVAGGPWQLGPVPSHHSLNEIERVEVVPEQQLDELRAELAEARDIPLVKEVEGEYRERLRKAEQQLDELRDALNVHHQRAMDAEQSLAEATEALERIAGPQTMNSYEQELRACKADARSTLARLKGEA